MIERHRKFHQPCSQIDHTFHQREIHSMIMIYVAAAVDETHSSNFFMAGRRQGQELFSPDMSAANVETKSNGW